MVTGFIQLFITFLHLLGASAAASNFSDALPGARQAGMGHAHVSMSDDVFGMFYNPAGLAGAQFAQMGASLGRTISPRGIMSVRSAAYSRPFPNIPGSTFGAAFSEIDQPVLTEKNEKNQLLLHFSHSLRVPRLNLTNPVKFGGNFKIIVVNPEGKPNRGTPALDLGMMLEPASDIGFGASVIDLSSGLPVDVPTFNLGSFWRVRRRVTFAADLRVRPGLAMVMPGVEADFFQRLLKLRVGRALPLDQEDALAIGAGVNFSPLVLDFSASFPTGGISRSGGGFEVAASWRFGAPPFSGRFVGTAAREAEDLRSEIMGLEKKLSDLRSQNESASSDKNSLEGQVQAEESRLRELQKQSRDLEYDISRRRYNAEHPLPLKAPPPPEKAAVKPNAPEPRKAAEPSKPSLPLRHKVQPGDTLRSIAEKYYGDPSLWESVYEANPDRVERGLPVEGVDLLIPKLEP